MRLLLLLLLASPAWAACPGTPTDCFYGLIHIHTSLSADWQTCADNDTAASGKRQRGAGCCHDGTSSDTVSGRDATCVANTGLANDCISVLGDEYAETNCEPETLFDEYRLVGSTPGSDTWDFVFVSDHFTKTNIDASDWTAIKAAATTVNAYAGRTGGTPDPRPFLAVPGIEYTPNGVNDFHRGHMGIYGSGLASLPSKPNVLGSWSSLCQWVRDPNGDGNEADNLVEAGTIVLVANHPGAAFSNVVVDFMEADQTGAFTVQYPGICTGLISGFEVDGDADWERRRVYSRWQAPSQVGATDYHDDRFWNRSRPTSPTAAPNASTEIADYTVCDLDDGDVTWPDGAGTLTEGNLFTALMNGKCWDAEWARTQGGSRDTRTITAFPSHTHPHHHP